MCLLFDLKQCFSNFSVHPNDVEVLLKTQIGGPHPVSDAVVLGLGIWLSDKFLLLLMLLLCRPLFKNHCFRVFSNGYRSVDSTLPSRCMFFERVIIFKNSFIFTLLLRILLNWSRSSRNIVLFIYLFI